MGPHWVGRVESVLNPRFFLATPCRDRKAHICPTTPRAGTVTGCRYFDTFFEHVHAALGCSYEVSGTLSGTRMLV